jgi:hypothetical protein
MELHLQCQTRGDTYSCFRIPLIPNTFSELVRDRGFSGHSCVWTIAVQIPDSGTNGQRFTLATGFLFFWNPGMELERPESPVKARPESGSS